MSKKKKKKPAKEKLYRISFTELEITLVRYITGGMTPQAANTAYKKGLSMLAPKFRKHLPKYDGVAFFQAFWKMANKLDAA